MMSDKLIDRWEKDTSPIRFIDDEKEKTETETTKKSIDTIVEVYDGQL